MNQRKRKEEQDRKKVGEKEGDIQNIIDKLQGTEVAGLFYYFIILFYLFNRYN
jgi:hypothetical protein